MSIPGLGGGGGSSSGGSTQTTIRQERSGLSSNAAQNLSEYVSPLVSQQVLPGAIERLTTPFETAPLGPSGLYATQEGALQESLGNAVANRGADLARRGFVGSNAPALAANLGSRDVLEQIMPQVGQLALEAFTQPEVVRRERLAQLMQLFDPSITGLLGQRSSGSTTGASSGGSGSFQVDSNIPLPNESSGKKLGV